VNVFQRPFFKLPQPQSKKKKTKEGSTASIMRSSGHDLCDACIMDLSPLSWVLITHLLLCSAPNGELETDRRIALPMLVYTD